MKLNTKIDFEGTLVEFVDFMGSTFKDHEKLVFKASIEKIIPAGKYQDLMDGIIRELFPGRALSGDSYEKIIHKLRLVLPNILEMVPKSKINAIKELRTATDCGLKEGKDVVEGILTQYVAYVERNKEQSNAATR